MTEAQPGRSWWSPMLVLHGSQYEDTERRETEPQVPRIWRLFPLAAEVERPGATSCSNCTGGLICGAYHLCSVVLSAAAFMSSGFMCSLLMLAEVTFCCHLEPGRYPLRYPLRSPPPRGEVVGDVATSLVTSDRFSFSSCSWYWE